MQLSIHNYKIPKSTHRKTKSGPDSVQETVSFTAKWKKIVICNCLYKNYYFKENNYPPIDIDFLIIFQPFFKIIS